MRIKGIITAFILFIAGQACLASTPETPSSAEQQFLAAATKLWQSTDRKQGEVKLPNGVATLQVPESFYYLSPADAEKVLVGIWGNPTGFGKQSQGMLFPAGVTPLDDEAWAVTIGYEEDGYVSDEDAGDIDYGELLQQMKQDTREESKQRLKQGYDSIELVGWASQPYYESSSHKLHWAKELKFGNDPVNTLNYNIRVLGRKGVLVLNFIAGMNQKEMISHQLDGVLRMAEFNQGYRYDDFNPDIDKVAAYGIGALVAGKVVAKTGLLAAALLLLKKFGIFILAGAAALFGKIFRRKPA